MLFPYSDIEEEYDHDQDGDDDNQTGAKTTLHLTETELNCDLHQALILGLERLDLMNDLHLKCRSRLDFCNELLEIAEDCAAGSGSGSGSGVVDDENITGGSDNNNSAASNIADHGYFLSRIVSGCTAETTLKWKSKLKQDK